MIYKLCDLRGVMPRPVSGRFFPLFVVIFCIFLTGCHKPTADRPKTQVRVAIGPVPPWVATLLTIYGNQIKDASFSRIDIPNASPALDYIEDGIADVSLVPADNVYIAFNKGNDT